MPIPKMRITLPWLLLVTNALSAYSYYTHESQNREPALGRFARDDAPPAADAPPADPAAGGPNLDRLKMLQEKLKAGMAEKQLTGQTDENSKADALVASLAAPIADVGGKKDDDEEEKPKAKKKKKKKKTPTPDSDEDEAPAAPPPLPPAHRQGGGLVGGLLGGLLG
ncbi:uncharacterized protein LOC110846516 [Folsomia candida]|uniref:Phthiocerol synthesis polyketide synthase type I PpsC n=1 Tax=Folsomia candida TaxID=158441 RepID=A0A226EIW8_FOLCA|nr:uncharacterized protein LOC110846516 [Folsomia candida]OXA57663.1 Phthiocerol synthesis polyketide synthase type I PpsC [Folsomia candida]